MVYWQNIIPSLATSTSCGNHAADFHAPIGNTLENNPSRFICTITLIQISSVLAQAVAAKHVYLIGKYGKTYFFLAAPSFALQFLSKLVPSHVSC